MKPVRSPQTPVSPRRLLFLPLLLAACAASRAQTVSSVVLHPASVLGGGASVGTVKISKEAPAGGFSVALSSSSPSATVPSTVTVAPGSWSASFKIGTVPVAATATATIGASAGASSASSDLTISAPALESTAIAPRSVIGGMIAIGAVEISGAAPTGGATLALSSDSSFAPVPASVTVPAGKRTATFQIATLPVSTSGTATITATFGSVTDTVTLDVKSPSLVWVKIAPATIKGGKAATGAIELNGAAPTGGETITLASDSTFATPPATVTVAAGKWTGSFQIATSPVATDAVAHVTATLGTVAKTAELIVAAPRPLTLTLVPAIVTGGAESTGQVELDGPAPTGGSSVTLTSNSSKATVPASVTVPAGATMATFVVTTVGVAVQRTAAITALLSDATKKETLTILPPQFLTFTVSPTSVVGGASTTGTVTLSSPAPDGGLSITLTSNSASAVVPGNITVAAGQTSATFTVTTSVVTKSITATVTATLGTVTRKANIHVDR